LYGLGSISKQFTATAIMLLVEEGKIGLDHRLTNYFRWLPKEWDEVTVRHLLTHTSGIRQEQWKDGIVEFDRFEHSQEEIVKTAFGPMLARPGEKFGYSNVGYRLLGMLIEKVSGQSYWDFLANRIFRPIGMVSLNDGTTFKYGFGWFLRPVPGHRTVAHGGGLPVFSTFIWRFIDDGLTVIVLSNCETADTGRIALGVAGLYVPALLSPEIKKQL
jgi:CubicO group peptidase (beta-lactamase class C family)